MNLLKSVETTIANLVEGAFGRVFRSEVRPMEIARRLAREMDEHRTVSVSRVYAPNEFEVWLSEEDRARYEGIEAEVVAELCSYLLEHARREQLILPAALEITFHTDERLSLGEFGIHAESVGPGVHAEESSSAPQLADEPSEHGNTMIYSTSARQREPLRQAPRRRSRALLAVGDQRLIVGPAGAVIGRSRESDIVLEDTGISRRHAEIRPDDDGWVLHDLGSTNGVLVNGSPLSGSRRLTPGDVLELGSTRVVFEQT